MRDLFSPDGRRKLYDLAAAVLALLGTVGVVSDALVPKILGVVSNLLAVAALVLARSNVPKP